MKVIACLLWCSILGFSPSWAQTPGPSNLPADVIQVEPTDTACVSIVDLPPVCDQAFAEWQGLELEWRDWMVEHGGRPIYKGIGSRPGERLQRPIVPAWIVARCGLLEQEGLAPDQMCQFYRETLKYDWPEHLEEPQPPPVTRVAKANGELGDFWTWFLKSLHYDGLWVVPDTRYRAYLLAGVHVAWAQVTDRMYLFGPGVMLVMMPDGTGKNVFRPAQTWGVSIRLKDVKLFKAQREFSLYFNIANSRVFGHGPEFLQGGSRGLTVVGFSISPRKD